MRLAILACLVTLGACGGSGPSDTEAPPVGPPPSATVYVQGVAPGVLTPPRLGQYDNQGPDGLIRVRDDLSPNPILFTRVLTHELGHAIGLQHLPGTGCVMDTDAIQTPNSSLCPQEVAFAQAYAGPVLTVYAGLSPPDLWQITSNAASIWNQAAGRTILSVQ